MRTFVLSLNAEKFAVIQAESLEKAAEALGCDVEGLLIAGTLAVLRPRWSLGEAEMRTLSIKEVSLVSDAEALKRCFRRMGYTV